MAAAILKVTGLDTELVPGSNGIYDVTADGEMIFSRKKAGRFPTEQEIIDLLKKRL